MSEKPTKIVISKDILDIYIASLRWEAPLTYSDTIRGVAIYTDIHPFPKKSPFAILAPIRSSK